MLRRTMLFAAGVVLLLLGAVAASGRSTADPFVGTWAVSPRSCPGCTPLPFSGSLTITSGSRSEAEAFRSFGGNQPGGFGIQTFCLGQSGFTPPNVSAWYLAHYTWGSGDDMAGCTSDKTGGQLFLFGHGTEIAVYGINATDMSGVWFNNPAQDPSYSWQAKRATHGETKTVDEPKPGGSIIVTSPSLPALCSGPGRAPSASTCTTGTGVSLSDYFWGTGTIARDTTVVAPGGADLLQGTRATGEAVAACWLIGPDALTVPKNLSHETEKFLKTFKFFQEAMSPEQRIYFCLKLVVGLGREPGLMSAARTSQARLAGCRAGRLALLFRTRKGKVVSVRLTTKRSATAIFYNCATSGTTLTIQIDGRKKGNLRKQVGAKLKLGVYRTKNAPKTSGKLTFTFGW